MHVAKTLASSSRLLYTCDMHGAPSRIAVEAFQEVHGLRACMVAPTKIIAGLGMSLGMDCLVVPGATGGAHSSTSPYITCTHRHALTTQGCACR